MTVAELIQELQRFPSHHRVFVEHEVYDPSAIELKSDWAAVYDVRADDSCTVIIDSVRSMT